MLIDDRSMATTSARTERKRRTATTSRATERTNTFNGITIMNGSDDNDIGANRIGLNIANAVAVGNAGDGIQIRSSASNNIGDSESADTSNYHLRQRRGRHPAGHQRQPDRGDDEHDRDWIPTASLRGRTEGKAFIFSARRHNYIGDTGPSANFISGNQGSGIKIEDPQSQNNVVVNNLIGVNSTGSVALGNSDHGIGSSIPRATPSGPSQAGTLFPATIWTASASRVRTASVISFRTT